MFTANQWRPLIVAIFLASLLIAGVLFTLYLRFESDRPSVLSPPNPSKPPPPSAAPLGYYIDAAVTANCQPCAIVGRDVLLEGGSAVDAALATLFCDGVACLQSMGLGGGFFMTIYNRTTGEVHTLNARETAPSRAHHTMYGGDSGLSTQGGLSVAVPGELRGYWEAHKKFGKLPWRRLIEPSIKACREGTIVSSYVAKLLEKHERHILASESMHDVLLNPSTGTIWRAGDRIYRFRLARTLQTIAEEGGDALYTGSLSTDFVSDIQAFGGIITRQDMASYRVRWEPPVTVPLVGNLTLFSMPTPGSGHILAFIMNVLENYLPVAKPALMHHRIVETFKWAFGQRTKLGDPHFASVDQLLHNLVSKDTAHVVRDSINDFNTWQDPQHYGAEAETLENDGTAHVNILAADGSAVAVTSTINSPFGAMIRSKKTDIILNNQMDDFSAPNITNLYGLPPSPANFIAPGKRPLSSMCPTILVDGERNVRLVIGASGGTKIATATPWVMMRHLWLNETIKEAIDARRVHHQLMPMLVQYEFGVTQEMITGLKQRDHKVSRLEDMKSASVNAIARTGEYITANADFRRAAVMAGY